LPASKEKKQEDVWSGGELHSLPPFILHPSSFILHPSSFIILPSAFLLRKERVGGVGGGGAPWYTAPRERAGAAVPCPTPQSGRLAEPALMKIRGPPTPLSGNILFLFNRY